MAARMAGRGRTTVVVVVALLAGAAVSPTAATAAAKIQDVFVTNGTNNPVPTRAVGVSEVTGGVAVTNTPTVKAQPDGVFDVNLTGTDGAVEVVQARPEAFKDGGRVARINVGSGWSSPSVAVPPGSDLVVTSVSARTQETSDGTVRAMRVAPDTGIFDGAGLLHIAFQREMPAGVAAWVAYAQTDLYVTDSLNLGFNGAWPGGNGDNYRIDWAVNGYLVDEPAP